MDASLRVMNGPPQICLQELIRHTMFKEMLQQLK